MSARTTAPDVLVVGEHVARNPIARAVARQRLRQAATAFGIRIYLLQEDEQVAADGYAAGRTVYLAYVLARRAGRADSADARVMHGAISALTALAERQWRWRTADTVAIDTALQRAEHEIAAATAQQLQAAWLEVEAADRAADARARRAEAAC